MYNKKCINISTTLSALEKQYGKYDFVFPYQSYLVNLARVESFDIKNRYLYFDIIIRKVIECVKVLSKTEILIIFKGGFEVKVDVDKK